MVCFRQLKVVEDLQNALDDMGAIKVVVLHLNSGVSDVIIREALALMVMLLFSGNTKVQVN